MFHVGQQFSEQVPAKSIKSNRMLTRECCIHLFYEFSAVVDDVGSTEIRPVKYTVPRDKYLFRHRHIMLFFWPLRRKERSTVTVVGLHVLHEDLPLISCDGGSGCVHIWPVDLNLILKSVRPLVRSRMNHPRGR